MNLTFVFEWFRRYWLGLWFGVIFVIRLGAFAARGPADVGFDARLYLDATRAWLAGGDPWAIALDGQRFAAPPPTLLPLAPLAVLPEVLGVAVMLGLAVAGVVATVRLLRLPWWWLLFPPFLDGWWNGNPQTLLIPLILLGAGPVAAFLKIYAIVPIALTLRWRAFVVTLVALVVTAPLLPWSLYLAQFAELGRVLEAQSAGGLSATAVPWLIPIGVVALLLCGRERAAWLAVPVLWPSTQWYYSTLAVPAVTSIAAAILAFQLPGAPVVAAVAVAVETGARSWPALRASWARGAAHVPPPATAPPAA